MFIKRGDEGEMMVKLGMKGKIEKKSYAEGGLIKELKTVSKKLVKSNK